MLTFVSCGTTLSALISESSIPEEELAGVAQTAVLSYKGLDESALEDNEQKDYIVDLQGIILAFAGRVLLQRTNFSLERGKTYGVVGQNGTGKTVRSIHTGSHTTALAL